MKSIICVTTDFAIALVCGTERARNAISEARSIQSFGDGRALCQFSVDLHLALTKMQKSLSRAQQGMKDVSIELSFFTDSTTLLLSDHPAN